MRATDRPAVIRELIRRGGSGVSPILSRAPRGEKKEKYGEISETLHGRAKFVRVNVQLTGQMVHCCRDELTIDLPGLTLFSVTHRLTLGL